VDFNPEQDKRIIQRGLLHVHVKKLGPYLFDGSMLFSSTKYNDVSILQGTFYIFLKIIEYLVFN